MTIEELKIELDKLEVSYDSTAKKAVLEELLESSKVVTPIPESVETPTVETPTVDKPTVEVEGVEVKDPEIYKPQDLPLVITPKSGKWKNDNQAKYAKVLNGYAYRNKEKWDKKKKSLLKKLVEVGEDPEKYFLYASPNSRLTYGNKLAK